MDLTRLFTPEFHADPYPVYREMRQEDPLLDPGEGFGSMIATGWEPVQALLRDGRFKSGFTPFEDEELSEWQATAPVTYGFFQRNMLGSNPPDHTRLRALVNRAFTPRVVQTLRPRVEAIVSKLLDEAAPRGEMDVVADFAYPLPLTVIAELLGIPPEDREELKRASQPFTRILDSMTRETHLAEAEAAGRWMTDYFLEQFDRHRARPGDDLIDGLLAARDAGDRLSDDELLATCMLLLVAGHETTTNLIGNGLLALLRQRDQWERLCREPGLVETAVEELLRFDSPVQFTSRRPWEKVEAFGHEIAADREVLLVLGAANRDPERFPDPDRLDVGRPDNAHLSFGQGIHFCVGASLARLEACAAFQALAHRFPEIELASDEVSYRPGFVIRALESLRVRL